MEKIKGSHYTNPGGREENEDSCRLFNNKEKGYCAVVADGLGGYGGGAKASSKAVEIIEERFLRDVITNPEEFNIWFQKVNQEVLNMQTAQVEMKTTLVVLLIKDESAMWAHIGDSRLYHFVDGSLVEQTFDHSVSQMAVLRGEISQEEIRGHIDRNRLLRAIGREDTVRIDISKKISMKGQKHAFLLCTDGFWEYILEKEMENDLKESSNPDEWLRRMVSRVEERTQSVKNDNNTAITVMYEG